MKKIGFGSRLLAFLLVFLMLVSIAPLSALAGTVGWITTGDYAGQVGFDTSTQNQDGTINWPIKIYDYLADGMLFDFPENSTTSMYAESYSNNGGGMYGGGEPMPVTKLGYDFTGDWAHSAQVNTVYKSSETYSHVKTKKAASANSSPQYLRITRKSSYNTNYKNCMVTTFTSDYSGVKARDSVRYMALVYRANGLGVYQGNNYLGINTYSDANSWSRLTDNGIKDINGNYVRNTNGWTYVVIDLKMNCDTDAQWNNFGTNGVGNVYFRLGLSTTSSYFDISHIAYFGSAFEADQYGKDALAFVKNPGTKLVTATSKSTAGKWNVGNNRGFGLLMPSTGGGWSTGGGTSSLPNGYQSYRIGYSVYTGDGVSSLATDTYNNARKNLNGNLIGNNQIYFVTDAYKNAATYKDALTSDSDPNNDNDYTKGYNTKFLDMDGYDLLTNVTSGLMTMGMLDNKLQNGLPVYRIEAIEYVAEMLYKTLPIPQVAASGNYNYNYVKGVADTQFGTDSSGKALDLPQALRNCLGITFTSGKDKGSTPTYGNYSDTAAKHNGLMGEFKNVKGNIKTCMDAAYFLLNNLFVENSYNQTQSDFRYLTLSSATMDDGRKAYVFDGGFTTGDASTLQDTQASQDAYKKNSQSSLQYSSFKENGDGTISLGPVKSKDQYWYESNASTTQYPFLPVKNATGTYAGETKSYYFIEDGYRGYTEYGSTYVNRNYNYVMASNGEFVFHEEDDLYFQFEGDDDVYLFLNNELVLDIGGAHGISRVEFDVNDYVEWAKEVLANPSAYTEKEVARAKALNLEDGEIVSFDFYYMERHGTGANCRIVTNMHITDPAIRTQKQAYQNGKEIDYGGIVDGEHRIEYAFTTTNGGNTKLYNFTYDDADIGVKLTPDGGLSVKGDDTPSINDDINGIYVTDVRGERLEANDLIARVTGYKDVGIGNGEYSLEGTEYVNVGKGNGRFDYADVTVTFTDNQALKNFLKTLDSNVTDTETVDEEQTRRGSGLWVDATLSIRGIYYTMTSKQRDAGYFSNTVLVTATTKSNPQSAGNEILRGDDNHRVYITAIPAYYQWKDHEVHILETRVLEDAISEAGKEGSQLHDYKPFFDKITQSGKGINAIWTTFCDKNGKKLSEYEHVKSNNPVPNDATYWGFTANYDTTGIHEFYLLMYLQEEVAGHTVSGDVATMEPGDFAIVRVLVIVSDVEDTKYVLDYGLKSENLDTNGELFRNDDLLGSMSGTEAKLMGINTTGGEYLSVSSNTQNYNRIDFNAMQLDEHNNIYVNGGDGKADGFYTFNMNIGENGKEITYNAFSGMYSLTDSGTTHVHAETPGAWGDMYLYYWYDDGRSNGWPGEKMNKTSAGNYSLDIPGNVPHIIISDGTNQSIDLTINPGEEVWIDFGDDPQLQNGKYLPVIEYKSRDGIIHASVPEGWGDVYYYCWDAFSNAIEEWPGTKIEKKDSDGYYTVSLPGDITNVIINNGEGIPMTNEDGEAYYLRKQTTDLTISAGKETWINVNATPIENTSDPEKYTAVATQSLEKVLMHATVPSFWGDAYLYYWNSNGSYTGVEWPGIKMENDAETGVYSLEVPADVENIIISDGKFRQTENLSITAGLETWVNVEVLTSNATVQSSKPADWEDIYFYFYKDGYVGDVADAWPGTRGYDLFDTGIYSINVPPYATHVVINNGVDKKTKDLALSADTINNFIIEDTGETVVQATIPSWWFETSIHYWNENTGESTTWPGVSVTPGEDGTITFLPPEGTTHVILNARHNPESDDRQQTADIKLEPNAINRINVYDHYNQSVETLVHVTSNITKVTPPATTTKAAVTYGIDAEKEGFSFTPTNFMDFEYNLWMALTVHDKNVNPTKLGQAIDIGKEVQMIKKVTVLPANVVYYEDTFAGITYADKYTTSNVINHYTSGSGSLTQSIDQNQQYGNDKTYQTSDNGEITGGSLTDVYINDQNEFATFTFTGTGFEIIGHNHAQEGGTLMVELYDENNNFIKKVPVITEFDNGGDGGKESIVTVPIVRISGLDYGTYNVKLKGVPVFDFDNWTDFSKLPPVAQSYLCIDGIRIYQPINSSAQIVDRQNLALNKTYTGANVAEADSLNGVYYTANLTDGVASDVIDTTNGRAHWFGYHKTLNHKTAADGTPYGQFTVDLEDKYSLDQFKMHVGSKSFGAPSYVEVYVSDNNTNWTFAGSANNIDYNAANPYWAEVKLDKAVEGRYVRFNFGFIDPYYWVFVNEVEIYGDKTITGPGVHDAYIDKENGADFIEIRDLIEQRKAFAIKYTDDNGLSVSGGTNTWIENRNNVRPGDHNTKWTNNTVTSVNDYLIAGPNNEVYMVESTQAEQSAVAFYVKETGSPVATMQIGIRALDYRSFVGSTTTGKYNAEVQYGAVGDDGNIVWRTLVTTTTPVEQYYEIPYTECPYDEVNDRYQVVLRVADTTPNGMAAYTTLKYNGLELLTLNESEVPDVTYGEDIKNVLLDSNGNTLDASKFVGFIDLVDQMNGVVEQPEQGGTGGTTTPTEPVITGNDTASMGVLYDQFTANTSDFGITEKSKIYIVTESESTAPAQDVLDTAQLVQRQFAADGYDMKVVWGLAKYIEKNDIVVYVNSGYFAGVANYDEAYKLEVSSTDLQTGAGAITTAKLYTRNSDGMLYGLNTLQKHFRAAGKNAIKGFTIVDAPDTKERTLHLDVARKYLTKEMVKNYIAEISWMGYNAIELHMSEDGGFRMDFWGNKALNEVPNMTGNDFSWLCGSNPASWVYTQFRDDNGKVNDKGKYLTTEEVIEICETAKEYHIDIIPSFDTPAHVDYMTKLYYNTVQANSNSPIRNFTYNGTNYTLPTRIHYRNTGYDDDYCVLNLGDTAVKNFAYAMYNDIAAFFKYYAGSTDFNICSDEVGLKSTDPWTYTDFINYVNNVNSILNEQGYTTRMYNDFVYKNYTSSVKLASNIDIVYWLPYDTSYQPNLKTAKAIADDGRQIYSGINWWTYYVLRIAPTSKKNNLDARDPNNSQWWFSRNQEDRIYNEWNPSRTSSYNNGNTYDYSGSQLAGGYFMIWNDFAGLNTEVEVWNGCYDTHGTYNSSTGTYSGNGNYYSLIERMWSSGIKQWNSDINSTLTFANFETLRDKQGFFPGYVATPSTEKYAYGMNLPAEEEVEGQYRTYHEVTFKNWDGSVIETKLVKEGTAATAPVATPTRPATVWYTYTFTGWDTDFSNITGPLTVKAQYSESATVAGKIGYFEVKNSGGSDIQISIDGGAYRPVGTSYINPSMEFGKLVSMKATTNNDNKFVGWINAKTGEVIKTEPNLSIYTTGNDVIIAMYESDHTSGKSLVTFKNDKSNQIIDVQYYGPDDIMAFPVVADYPGYKFVGWDKSDIQIMDALSKGENITITTKWVAKDVYFKVKVNGGSLTSFVSGGVNDMYQAYKATVVTADTPQSGQKFAYWVDEQGRIVSFDAEYKFYPHKNTELTAVYTSSSATIGKQVVTTVDIDATTLGDANTVFFSWDMSTSDYTLMNVGVLLAKKEHYYSSTFGVGSIDKNVYQFVPIINHNTFNANTYSITIPNVQAGDTWVAKSFVQYKDNSGVIRIAYSDLCEVTKPF